MYIHIEHVYTCLYTYIYIYIFIYTMYAALARDCCASPEQKSRITLQFVSSRWVIKIPLLLSLYVRIHIYMYVYIYINTYMHTRVRVRTRGTCCIGCCVSEVQHIYICRYVFTCCTCVIKSIDSAYIYTYIYIYMYMFVTHSPLYIDMFVI